VSHSRDRRELVRALEAANIDRNRGYLRNPGNYARTAIELLMLLAVDAGLVPGRRARKGVDYETHADREGFASIFCQPSRIRLMVSVERDKNALGIRARWLRFSAYNNPLDTSPEAMASPFTVHRPSSHLESRCLAELVSVHDHAVLVAELAVLRTQPGSSQDMRSMAEHMVRAKRARNSARRALGKAVKSNAIASLSSA
jgi:hypothetical protein